MNPVSSFSEQIQQVFKPTPRGVVGLVDNMLGLCRDQGVRLDFRDSRCHVLPLEGDVQDSFNAPLPKGVIQAFLARIAALCNERVPNSVTPYHGEGEIAVGVGAPAVFHVAFTNTPTEQWLEVKPVTRIAADPGPEYVVNKTDVVV